MKQSTLFKRCIRGAVVKWIHSFPIFTKRFSKQWWWLALTFFTIALVCAWQFKFPPFKKYYIKIPIQLSSAHTPYAEVEIENEKYSLLVDTGFDAYLVLKKQVLDKIKKTPLNEVKWIDMRGNQYVSSTYWIPELKMNDRCRFKQVTVDEGSSEFLSSGGLIHVTPHKSDKKPRHELSGTLGFKLLSTNNLFLDLSNSAFFFVKDKRGLANLKIEGYSIEKLSPVSLETDPKGIVFVAETDTGKKRFLLDTGATISVIHEDLAKGASLLETSDGVKVIKTSKFVIDTVDFGEMHFYPFKIADAIKIDGIIGMDFLMNHVIYIDFKEKKALIGPSKKLS